MLDRPFWKERLQQAWSEAPIAWLCGVRRCGKTTLAESLGESETLFVNCDLPATEELVRDPQMFFKGCKKPAIVFDEIHQLPDPSRVLKIGADLFPKLRILATGSSTLAASKKFRDTLTGRKRTIHMLPVLWEEFATFGTSLEQRLFHGGLPPALLAPSKKPSFYREWLDSFFARDIQRLFGFRDMNRFNAFFEYMLRQSGGVFESTKTATALGISRPTVESHLRALEITHAATLVRPYHSDGRGEIVKAPKVYLFDTGFVSFARGWDPLRATDLGVLWEHLVLEHLQAHLPATSIHYWRDKARHEVDFVVRRGRDAVDAIECTWDPSAFDGTHLKKFRSIYPQGRNYLLTPAAEIAYSRQINGMEIQISTPDELYVR
ncbi:MAG: ATP-binding protein [Planctomycetes bacterium]|nr:ATP-binding protein [Planctomycetota bacterium]